jgi:hypothetical protein
MFGYGGMWGMGMTWFGTDLASRLCRVDARDRRTDQIPAELDGRRVLHASLSWFNAETTRQDDAIFLRRFHSRAYLDRRYTRACRSAANDGPIPLEPVERHGTVAHGSRDDDACGPASPVGDDVGDTRTLPVNVKPPAAKRRHGRARRVGLPPELRLLSRRPAGATGRRPVSFRPVQPILPGCRECRWWNGTPSCTGPSPRAARRWGRPCRLSRTLWPRTTSGRSSPISKRSYRQRRSRNSFRETVAHLVPTVCRRAVQGEPSLSTKGGFGSRLCKNFRAFSHEPVSFAFARP